MVWAIAYTVVVVVVFEGRESVSYETWSVAELVVGLAGALVEEAVVAVAVVMVLRLSRY